MDYGIKYTDYAGHATTLAKDAVRTGEYTHIIAVGGDGTVNEVGRALYGSDIAFGIISLGSGNGFARHMGYSIKMKKALKQILSDIYVHIDMVEMNGSYFLNVSGVGFDAEVAHEFNRFKMRGLVSYIIAGIKMGFRYVEKEYTITYDGKSIQRKCFILSFANTRQYGNNVNIAPHASLTDGLLDICILQRPPFWGMISLLNSFIKSDFSNIKYYEEIQCKEARIEGKINKAHIDGDAINIDAPIHLKVHKGALKVILPRIERL